MVFAEMANRCKDLCLRFEATRKNLAGLSDALRKLYRYCRMCEYYVMTSKIYCECCGVKRRFFGIGKKDKRKKLADNVKRILDRDKAYSKKSYQKNRAVELERSKNWNKSHKDKIKEISRRYYLKYRDRLISEAKARRKKRLTAMPIFCTINNEK